MVMMKGEELEDEAAGRQYTTKASVPAYSDLTARHPPSSSSPAFQRQPPEAAAPRSSRSWPEKLPPRTTPRQIALPGGRPGADDGAAGIAQGRCVRHLVGRIILPPVTLVIVVAVLLVAVARGGAFDVG